MNKRCIPFWFGCFYLCFCIVGIGPVATAFGRSPQLAKFEPQQGCYIGAFIERDNTVHGDIEAFEGLTGKKHASYFTYVGYGRPFPAAWVAKVKARHAAPHIAFEPNNGLNEVQDDDYLRDLGTRCRAHRLPHLLALGLRDEWPLDGLLQKPSAIYRKISAGREDHARRSP